MVINVYISVERQNKPHVRMILREPVQIFSFLDYGHFHVIKNTGDIESDQ